MAKSNKEKEIKKTEIEEPVVKKSSGRPKKNEEVKLPTKSLKELEEENVEIEYVASVDVAKDDSEDLAIVVTSKKTIDETGEPIFEVVDVNDYIPDTKIITENINDNVSSNLNEVLLENKKEKQPLSYMGEQYRKYIEYLKITPEAFLQKYPKHKFKHCVEEIIEWKVKNGE